MLAEYQKNHTTGRETLSFDCEWRPEMPQHEIHIDSQLGLFKVLIKKSPNRSNMFTIILNQDEDVSTLKVFTNCTLDSFHGRICTPFVSQPFGDYSLDEDIPFSFVNSFRGVCQVELCLSTDAPPRIVEPITHEYAFLEKLYNVTSTHDVFFVHSGNDTEMNTIGPCATIEPMSKTTHTTETGNNSWDLFSKSTCPNNTFSSGHKESTGKFGTTNSITKGQLTKDNANYNGSHGTNETVVGAQKAVLYLYDYFGSLLDSEAMRGNSGPMKIVLTGLDLDTMKQMIRFMHLQKVTVLLLTFQDEENGSFGPKKATWESLYIASERYKIVRLRDLARTKLLNEMNEATAIPFLFRMGYNYQELREPTVKYIGSELHSVVVKREFRDRYRDHSQFLELLYEMIEVYEDAHSDWRHRKRL
ncbi:hypothetical protein BGZ81_004877 [Podila clonocystis]|nr:hypothetical protein BGZ81_004877 [Podila clonocystis]